MSTDMLLEKTPSPRSAISPASEYVTLEEYFAIAAESEFKVEYIDGELVFMPNVTHNHSLIQMNVGGYLFGQLAFGAYSLHSSDLRVKPTSTSYVFPDLCVVRGKSLYAGNSTDLLNPVLVVEVTSPSSINRDRIRKLQLYREIPSLEHYLIIEQQRVYVELHSRIDGIWAQRVFTDLGAAATLESLGASLSLAQIYRGIDF